MNGSYLSVLNHKLQNINQKSRPKNWFQKSWFLGFKISVFYTLMTIMQAKFNFFLIQTSDLQCCIIHTTTKHMTWRMVKGVLHGSYNLCFVFCTQKKL